MNVAPTSVDVTNVTQAVVHHKQPKITCIDLIADESTHMYASLSFPHMCIHKYGRLCQYWGEETHFVHHCHNGGGF